MQLVMLGTAGGPRPSPDRAAPAQALVIDGHVYVVDSGTGVARQMVLAGLQLSGLEAVFITHHHIDHTADLGNLPLLAWTAGRKDPMRLFGPPPMGRILDDFLSMVEVEISARTATTGRVPFPELVTATDVNKPGPVYADERVRVSTTLVDHPPLHPALAYRFDTPNRSVVISGDTRYSDNLVDLARDADVLVHEAVHERGIAMLEQRTNAPAIRAHMLSSHTTPEEAGLVAHKANVDTLVLSHLVPASGAVSDEEWASAARKHFSGEIVVARDLMTI
jgi:ribonuclease BN (tRNA processing enzyme)